MAKTTIITCPFCGKQPFVTYKSPRYKDDVFEKTVVIGCKDCNFFFTDTVRFDFVDGELKMLYNGYDTIITKWNGRKY